MKLAFSTENVTARSFLEYCNITSRYGFQGFEVFDAYEEKKQHEDSIFHSATVAASKRKLVNRHIGISVLSFSERITRDTDGEKIKKTVEMVACCV